MKLSEAIRRGSRLIPQKVGYDGCAIVAAVHAMGRNHYFDPEIIDGVSTAAAALWPFLSQEVRRPLTGDHGSLRSVIGDLNGYDELNWTRERIADWVETIEDHVAREYRHDSHE